ncbi:MAG TPA: calcium-binding protein [Solirubrobacterales bacterium]|nr:calcium-binding protein [Solirubrobacterales bacterium]
MATVAKRLSFRALPALVASLVLATGAAQGATVEVRETLGTENTAALSFQAAAGEDNRLTITFTKTGDGYLNLTVKDEGAALSAGAGCTGGGEPGQEARCRMHEPKWGDAEVCGKMCLRPIPGTSWTDTMWISLGDGDNSFDGSAFSDQFQPKVDMNVESGAGNDEIITGAGEDRIDPGLGSDRVHSGLGFDRIRATAAPDGPDLYDSGTSIDKVSYDLRNEPVHLAGSTAGAAGEGDTLLGRFHVIGGNANDVLEGGRPQAYVLEGGPGDDVVIGTGPEGAELYGGPGNDQLSAASAGADSLNRLVGEGGNDTYQGGEGAEMIFENMVHQDWGSRPESSPTPESSGGDDVAYAEGNNDTIALGTGADRAYGGPGDDYATGESGADRIYGGLGRDQLVGAFGFDRLFGGPGSDRLFSGRTLLNIPTILFPEAADDGRDRVDCGLGRDVGNVNPWDRRLRCEKTRLLRPVSYGS